MTEAYMYRHDPSISIAALRTLAFTRASGNMFSVRTILFYEDEIKTWVTDEPAVVRPELEEGQDGSERPLTA